MDGLLLIDKPTGISSFSVIRRLRGITGIKKIGHAGTLDPLASGLLIILIGKACKQADHYLKLPKVYEATITLGETSRTDDAEGEKTPVSSGQPSADEVTKVLQGFIGDYAQQPPAYSALKIGGQRAYKLARQGKNPQLAPRLVTIASIGNIKYSYPHVSFTTEVGSGTYIRSLARDIGRELGVGAYLSQLRRTTIADFSITKSIQLEAATLETVKKNIILI